MRLPTLILFLTLSLCSFAQSKYSSFRGGVEFGLGASTILDFNRINNHQEANVEWLFLQFPFIPYQFGFVADKYINQNDYLEFGMIYAKRSASYILQHYSSNSSSTAIPFVNLYCVDIPIKYYKDGIKIFNRDFHSFLGITPSVLYIVEMSEGYYDIQDNYFNMAYLSISTGIVHQNGNRRFKLQLSSAVTSITKWKYKSEIQALNNGYKGVIFPWEVMAVYGWVIG